MKKTGFFIVFLSLFSIGCSSNNKHSDEDCTTNECQRQQAYEKVIAVHDAVMPKLTDIRRLKKTIDDKVAITTDSLVLNELEQLNLELSEADEAMWVWMRQFKGDLSDMPADEALDYLKKEQQKIDSVADKINQAIAEAENSLAIKN